MEDQRAIFAGYGVKTPGFNLKNKGVYGRVVGVHDGDTITVVLNIFDGFYKFSVRLAGIDTCEITSKNEITKSLAVRGRNKVLSLITGIDDGDCAVCFDTKNKITRYFDENVCIVYLKCGDFDKYGRLLADVYNNIDSAESFSSILIRENLAYIYGGKAKLTEGQQIELLLK